MATVTAMETTTATASEDTNTVLQTEDEDILGDIIQTEASHLIKDPKHENEKPYEIRYDTGGVIPRTNISNESRPILVRNFRPLENSRSFEEYGFSSAKIDCSMTPTEFDDDKRVEDLYYPAAEKLLRQKYPGVADIKILEHGFRKRHAQFPAATEEFLEFTQPATLVHIDFSPHSAARTARAAFKIAPDQYQRLLTVNLWKSLQGPGNDWPLALCDWRTTDRSSGSIAADVVFHNRFTENDLVYYSPKHEWYYFKDLGDDEVIIFRQTDSDLEGGGGVPHTSFYNPRADENAAPRVSIELRAYLFFK